MNVSLRPVEDRDLDTIYQQVTDPDSIRMAAFTAEDQTDRRAFLNRMSRLRADTSVSYRVIDVDGAIAGTIASFRIDNQREVTYWVDRTQWGKGIASAALQLLLAETAERPLHARAASDNVGSLRVLRKLGSDALASTATSHPVAVRRSRKRSCASTEVGTELCVSSWAARHRARPCHFAMRCTPAARVSFTGSASDLSSGAGAQCG
jgi:RimJ/RimL family protein N-acetyltransferase